MQKNNKARWVGLGITVLCIFATLVGSYIWVQADVQAVDTKATVINENVDELKEEGCLPSRDNSDSIIKIEGRLETIQVQQEAGFKEILDRLPEK